MRLGIYSDLRYVHDGENYATDLPFIRFVTALPPRVDELVVFGRLASGRSRAPYILPSDRVRFVPLPYYPSVFAVGSLASAMRPSLDVFRAHLAELDAVWLFGPHPLANVFALAARRRGVAVALGVRQDYPAYIRHRLPGPAWAWAVPAAWALELSFRILARRLPTVTVGQELASRYRAGRAPVFATAVSLVSRADVVTLDEALARRWDDELRLVAVGRLDPEKNPLLLLDILERLRGRGIRARLVVAGEGPLRSELERVALERRLADAVELRGDVPNGPQLWEVYRSGHVFVHTALTEGLPQVLVEAQAAGLPIVATAVGGIPKGLEDGTSALLVPPRDAVASALAVERIAKDEALRGRLLSTGLEAARRQTMESQLDDLADFLERTLLRDASSEL